MVVCFSSSFQLWPLFLRHIYLPILRSPRLSQPSTLGLVTSSSVSLHNLQHCTMAGRGGPARTNGTAASNKICQFKLVLLGESAVGKSSLVLRFVKGQFHEYQESTIGGKVLPVWLKVFWTSGRILCSSCVVNLPFLVFCSCKMKSTHVDRFCICY